jgi:site-specific DNA-methyltransferase (adenine-specific)
MADIRTVKIAFKDLEFLQDNPRKISRQDLERLAGEIKRDPKFFNSRPCLVNYQDGRYLVYAGFQRAHAANTVLKWKEIPCSVENDVPTDVMRRRAILDNTHAGQWDPDVLANWEFEPDELSEMWVSPHVWGGDVEEGGVPNNALNSAKAEEDDFEPPVIVETDIKRGDVFEIGQHRLMCGDSTSAEDCKTLFIDKVNCVFTDPPYGVSIGKKNVMLNSFQPSGRNLNDIKDDDLAPDDLKPILTAAFKNLKANMADDCSVLVTAPQGGELCMMMMMMKDAGLAIRHVLIWVKNAPTFSMGRLDYDYQHEPILFTWNKTHKRKRDGQFQTSIWNVEKPRSSKEHPTMKPVALPENAILNHSDPGDVIADIYLGSGTTMVAAHQLNRKCYGMELDPKYCEVIIRRMARLDSTLTIKRNGVDETARWIEKQA